MVLQLWESLPLKMLFSWISIECQPMGIWRDSCRIRIDHEGSVENGTRVCGRVTGSVISGLSCSHQRIMKMKFTKTYYPGLQNKISKDQGSFICNTLFGLIDLKSMQ